MLHCVQHDSSAQRLRRVIRLGSHEIEADDALHYGVRFVDLPVSLVAEALLLHAETMTLWRVQNPRLASN